MARSLTGVVTSNKADKTIVIAVHTRKTHPIYKKQYSITDKFIAHDEKNQANVGDKVIVTETRPISKRKRFTLSRVIETARIQHTENTEKAPSTKKKASSEETSEEVK